MDRGSCSAFVALTNKSFSSGESSVLLISIGERVSHPMMLHVFTPRTMKEAFNLKLFANIWVAMLANAPCVLFLEVACLSVLEKMCGRSHPALHRRPRRWPNASAFSLDRTLGNN